MKNKYNNLNLSLLKEDLQIHSFDNIHIREATHDLLNRYLYDFKLTDNLKLLAEEGIKNIMKYPLDKLSRWLGFIQGYIIFSGQSTVEIERDFSRPIFHKAYEADGINIPKSFDTKNIK
jgi:hypothetical protein